ncbi:hypothetical protein ACTSKR_14555 [Chitinibacteraceae bacterium HSL-7]
MSTTILCAERTVQPLSLSRLASTLRQRLHFQDRHQQFVLLPDSDPLATRERLADHLACGINPQRVQMIDVSRVPELHALSKQLISSGIRSETASTAAALATLKPALVSAQAASRTEVIAANAALAGLGESLHHHAQALLATRTPFEAPNASLDIAFNADAATLAATLMALPSGEQLGLPARSPDRHPVFQLLDLFEQDIHFLDDLKSKFRRGGLSETVVKAHLVDCAERQLAPMRERQAELIASPGTLDALLDETAEHVRHAARTVIHQLGRALG